MQAWGGGKEREFVGSLRGSRASSPLRSRPVARQVYADERGDTLSPTGALGTLSPVTSHSHSYMSQSHVSLVMGEDRASFRGGTVPVYVTGLSAKGTPAF